MASKWFHKRDGQSMVGRSTGKKFKAMVFSGQILPTARVRREGDEMMVEARRVKVLFPPRV